jgi:uncharacterized protein (TIGR03086 family)
VRQLTNHFLGTSEAMRRLGAGEDRDPEDPWGTGGDYLHGDWRGALSGQLLGVADGWSRDEAWDGMVDGSEMPMEGAGDMAYVELVLHGWDLARGTGQHVSYDDAAVAQADEILDQIGQMGRDANIFAPIIEVPDDAPAIDKMLAKSGRDPHWSPEA